MTDHESLPPGRAKLEAFLSKSPSGNDKRQSLLDDPTDVRIDDEEDQSDTELESTGKSKGKRRSSRKPPNDIDELLGEATDEDVVPAGLVQRMSQRWMSGSYTSPFQATSADQDDSGLKQRLSQRLSKHLSRRSSRKSDAQKETEEDHEEVASAATPSIVQRLSRRISRKSRADVEEDEENFKTSAHLSDVEEDIHEDDHGDDEELERLAESDHRHEDEDENEAATGNEKRKSSSVLQRLSQRLSRSHRASTSTDHGKEAAAAEEENEFAGDIDNDNREDDTLAVHEESRRNSRRHSSAHESDDDMHSQVSVDAIADPDRQHHFHEDLEHHEDEEDRFDDIDDDSKFPEEEEVSEEQDQPKLSRRQSQVQKMVSLFVSGAVNTKKEPEKRHSLTMLRKNGTLRRRQDPGKMSSKATVQDEFKFSLGPRRRVRSGEELEETEEEDIKQNMSREEEEAEYQERASSENIDADSEEDGPYAENLDPEAEGEAAEERKAGWREKLDRIRSMNASPTCPVCDKLVYRMEKLSDSRDRAFHYYCLKCEDCPKNLSGEVVHVMDEPGRTGGRMVLCATHYNLRMNGQGELVKGWRPDSTNINYGGKYENDPERARKAVSRSLGASLGRKPLCTRCGGEILLSDKNFTVIGMERFHLKCPEQSNIKHTPRHYVQAAPDRMPIVFSGFEDGKFSISFLLKIESEDAKENALMQHRLAPARLRYVIDEDAHSTTSKTVRVSNEFFDVSDRKHTFNLTEHPLTGKKAYCTFDADDNVVLSQSYKIEGGVVHGLNAALRYVYDERTDKATIEVIDVELTFELLDENGYTGAEAELHSKLKKKKSKTKRQADADTPDFSLILVDDFADRVKAEI